VACFAQPYDVRRKPYDVLWPFRSRCPRHHGDFRNLLLLMIPTRSHDCKRWRYWISGGRSPPLMRFTRVAKSISGSKSLAAPRRTGYQRELQRMSEAWNDVLQRLTPLFRRIRRLQPTRRMSCELRWRLSAPLPAGSEIRARTRVLSGITQHDRE